MRKKFEIAIGQFNGRFFFECHDTLEDLWMDAPTAEKPFFQGLLHIAVGFYHFEDANFKGARSQLTKAKTRLAPFLPEYRGVRLENLLEKIESFNRLARQKIAGGTDRLKTPAFPLIRWDKEKFY